jgi:hypothetical protein
MSINPFNPIIFILAAVIYFVILITPHGKETGHRAEYVGLAFVAAWFLVDGIKFVIKDSKENKKRRNNELRPKRTYNPQRSRKKGNRIRVCEECGRINNRRVTHCALCGVELKRIEKKNK